MHACRSTLEDPTLILALGITAWSLATIACGLAQTFPQLFAARMGVGIGEACLAPATYSLVSDLFRREHLGRAAGVIGASTTIGAGLSLMIGGGLLKLFGPGTVDVPVLGEIASWRAIFLLLGPPGFLVALLLMMFPEPTRVASAKLESTVVDIASDSYLAFFKANALVLVPILLASLANIFAASGAVAWGPTSLLRRFAITPSELGLWYGLAMMFGGLTGPMLGGLLSDYWVRSGRYLARMRLFLIGAPICATGQLLLCLAPWSSLAIVGQAINTTATAALSTAGLIVIQEVCPNRFRGQTVALATLVNNIVGLGLGPALVALMGERIFGALPYGILGVTLPSVVAATVAALVAISARQRIAAAVTR